MSVEGVTADLDELLSCELAALAERQATSFLFKTQLLISEDACCLFHRRNKTGRRGRWLSAAIGTYFLQRMRITVRGVVNGPRICC